MNVESPVSDGCDTRRTEADGHHFQASLGSRLKSCLEKNRGGVEERGNREQGIRRWKGKRKGRGGEVKEISSLVMKAERAISLCLYEVPPKPWLYGGLPIHRCFAGKGCFFSNPLSHQHVGIGKSHTQ